MWVRYRSLEEISGIEGPKEMSGMPAKYVCPVVVEKGDRFFTMICVLWHVTAPHNFIFFAELNGGITHWGRDKMISILLIFSNAFPLMKIYEFRLKYHWSLLLKVQLIIIQHRFSQWLGADKATSHYPNQWWLDYPRIYASLFLDELMGWPVLRSLVLSPVRLLGVVRICSRPQIRLTFNLVGWLIMATPILIIFFFMLCLIPFSLLFPNWMSIRAFTDTLLIEWSLFVLAEIESVKTISM